MAHVSIELQLAERFGHGRLWSGGVFTSSRAIPVERTDLDEALADVSRMVMGSTKRWHNQISPVYTSGGSANAQTLTHTVGHTALVLPAIVSRSSQASPIE